MTVASYSAFGEVRRSLHRSQGSFHDGYVFEGAGPTGPGQCIGVLSDTSPYSPERRPAHRKDNRSNLIYT